MHEKIQLMQELRSRGLSYPRIGSLTGLNHATVYYHLNPDFAMIKRAKMRKRYETVRGKGGTLAENTVTSA
jgi:hypothetical protein